MDEITEVTGAEQTSAEAEPSWAGEHVFGGSVLFGAAETLEADDDWRAYLRWLRRHKCYVPLGAPNIFAPP